MSAFHQLLRLAVGWVLVATYLRWRRRRRTGGLPYPPGPKPDPIIGNLRHVPKKSAWLTYASWGKQYGDVVSFEAFGTRVIVLNTLKAISDLLEKRGAVYSERHHNVMQDLMNMRTTNMVTMDYTDEFRLHRKVVNTALNQTASYAYFPIQEREAYALTERLLDTSANWHKEVTRFANSTILTVTYGHRVVTDDDYLVKLSDEAIQHLRQLVQPTAFLVNFLPFLKYLPDWAPGAGFKAFARLARQHSENLCEIPFKALRSQMDAGTAETSYCTRLIDAKGSITGRENEEGIIKTTAGIMYAAGSATTESVIASFILNMVLHPEVQKKVQAELDSVIGNSRLPTFADQDSLTYLKYCMQETLRWNPVSALGGVPHAAQHDDVYEGMFIPKGSVIIANQWTVMHDETMYPDPFKFWPERWDGRFPQARDARALSFGFNRRICPGRHLALNSLYITAATMMAAFNLSKEIGADGQEIEPLIDYSSGPPKPFKCRFTPRSDGAVALVKASVSATL
ncbi:hypothetical protein JAAARDRAFT_35056 [Jaapia argillacea MUCL 33604]|uniref:Cytochrome P450 n=1 Tax=Jaapia argillacea MUCL 33604 TaxID=933084 RepID=A0A067PTU8_9AGAM|nr:hypothetical protein JAAARDRAFT_35056 [Jaapia argillacea MUCL 33604]